MTVFAGDPIAASAVNEIYDGTLAKPMGRLVQAAAQALADNTQVAVTFGAGSTVYDTHTYHSESVNTTRVTPAKAGYYRFSGSAFFESQTTPVISDANIRKNGTSNQPAAWRGPGQTASFSAFIEVTIPMNGTTDYIELVMRQDSAGADNTNVSSQFASVLEWEFIRPL